MVGRCARAVKLLVDYMNKTPEVGEFTRGWESNVQFDLLGEPPFGVVFSKDGSVEYKDGRLAAPDVVFYSSSETFYGMLTGRIDQDEAFANGLIEIKGSIFDSVRFRHAAEITQKKHGTLFAVMRALSRFS